MINGNHGDYPYIRIAEKSYLATHVMKYIYEGLTVWDVDTDGNFIFCPGSDRGVVDASHLCHKPFCVNPKHVIFESSSLNIARNACLRRFKCKHHLNAPDCIFNVNALELPSILPKFRVTGKALKVILKYRLDIAEAKKLMEK
jgi:hypothetical protein